MNKRFIRTTFAKFESINKEQYKDCIVFIEDTKEIWVNGNYYARNDNEDSNILYDLETGLDLNGDLVKTVDKLIIDQNGLVYSNNELVINNIKVNNTIIEKDNNGAVEIPIGDLNIQSDWNEEDETSDAYIKNKPELFNGDYDNLTNKPTLFSGNYNDLTNKPTLFNGDYNDLINKPSVISKEDFDILKQEVEENEEVVAEALTDLDERINNSISEIKMNNTSKGTSGIIDLGTVVTDAVVSQTATNASITDGVLTIPALMGKDGEKGDDGISATHSWEGTTLTITSASGTSSADLKGEKGETGEKGSNGTFTCSYNDQEQTIFLNSDLTDINIGIINKSVINQTETTIEIQPNMLNIWGEVTSLDITLAIPTDTSIINEYMIQFTSGATATQLVLPDTIQWMNGSVINANATYQLSIINNLAVIGEWSNE